MRGVKHLPKQNQDIMSHLNPVASESMHTCSPTDRTPFFLCPPEHGRVISERQDACRTNRTILIMNMNPNNNKKNHTAHRMPVSPTCLYAVLQECLKALKELFCVCRGAVKLLESSQGHDHGHFPSERRATGPRC